MTSFHFPVPTRASRSSICEFAERTRKDVGLKNGFQLAELLRLNDGEIEDISVSDANQDDAMIVRPDGRFRIRVSSLSPTLRNNFIVAHGLGHRLLHWPLVKEKFPGDGMKVHRIVDRDSPDQVRCSHEATWFAAAFLMPVNEFEAAYHKGNADVIFSVNQQAVEIRAKMLGLVPEPESNQVKNENGEASHAC